MNYKETLFFIGKCLTIPSEEKNRKEIEIQLKTTEINWDSVVKISTAHYVFPALYCNFKKVNFLQYLPSDLVEYMKHITDLNRDRNQQIIDQAKEINELLLSINITPIFVKGTGNLLEGLYEDIAERMVGDIDFILKKNETDLAYKTLKKNNYKEIEDSFENPPSHRHLPRLVHKNNIGAVEIHKDLLETKHTNEFNYSIIIENTLKFENITVMSYSNQLSLSIIAKQINDYGFLFKNISLRNAYDVFLLSKKTNAKNAFDNFKKLQNPLNCFLATCYEIFGKVDSLDYTKTPETKVYFSLFNKYLLNESLRKKKYKKIERILYYKSRAKLIYKSIVDKEHRNWLLKKFIYKKQ